MSDRPIIFSAPMIRALLDGRKTQTRRVLKPQPDEGGIAFMQVHPDGRDYAVVQRRHEYGDQSICKPVVSIGDRLWVREAHYLTDDGDSEYAVFAEDANGVSDHLENIQTLMATFPKVDWSKHVRLRPSIHMPRWASRLTLIIADVRVERLQEISEADAASEGCDAERIGMASMYGLGGSPRFPTLARDEFRHLWNILHGPDAWDANPWVTAITFTVHKRNIDQMETDQ